MRRRMAVLLEGDAVAVLMVAAFGGTAAPAGKFKTVMSTSPSRSRSCHSSARAVLLH
jgi:hypothetical protein